MHEKSKNPLWKFFFSLFFAKYNLTIEFFLWIYLCRAKFSITHSISELIGTKQLRTQKKFSTELPNGKLRHNTGSNANANPNHLNMLKGIAWKYEPPNPFVEKSAESSPRIKCLLFNRINCWKTCMLFQVSTTPEKAKVILIPWWKTCSNHTRSSNNYKNINSCFLTFSNVHIKHIERKVRLPPRMLRKAWAYFKVQDCRLEKVDISSMFLFVCVELTSWLSQ